jgi:3-ketosteroid 9alpha-monooxygenase subunit B
MAISATRSPGRGAPGSRSTEGLGFHALRVIRIVRETAEASTFVLEVPDELRPAFEYEAGQFCTFRVWTDDRPLLRCYSMSSAPGVDAEMQVTVKRVPGGAVSNWMNDALTPGDLLEVGRPTGLFRLTGSDADVVAFGGGSGITPVFSLMKSALATTARRVRLLYANRDAAGVIFAGELSALRGRHPDRLEVAHHFDADGGFLTADDIRPYIQAAPDAEFYVCGPAPFMDLVEATLLAGGVDAARIHTERFDPPQPAAPGPAPAEATTSEVTIELAGRARTAGYRPGTTILQTARQMGLAPPFSCEAGNCATCMARLIDGRATMHANNALTDDEVADGWVLTCQAVPTTPSVHVVYGYEGT